MLLSDFLIHLRLSEFWLIHLIMSILPVADEIQHNILAELALVLDS